MKGSRFERMVTQIDTRKLYVQVADSITASIKSGEYPSGARLSSERELAVAFKVSRTTIREAMIALEIRGLVEARPGSGIYVSEHPPQQASAEDLDIGAFELMEARRLFEGEAAALAAALITDEQLHEIVVIIGEMATENARTPNRRCGRTHCVAPRKPRRGVPKRQVTMSASARIPSLAARLSARVSPGRPRTMENAMAATMRT